MITIANFSHPLSPEATAYIDQFLALNGGVREIIVPANFDLARDLTIQVGEIVDDAINQAGGNKYDIDCFIPPALNFAAVFIPAMLPTANMIVMARSGTPPSFMPAQLVRAGDMK